MFAIRGQNPLRIRQDSYAPEGFWDLSYEASPDWEHVRREYDYVWAYNVDRFAPQLTAIGELVYDQGDLQVYRLRKR